MHCGGEVARRCPTHALGWRIGLYELGMAVLQVGELGSETIIGDVVDRRIGENVITVVLLVEIAHQLSDARGRFRELVHKS